MRGKRGSGKSVKYSTVEEIKNINGLKDKSVETLREMEIGLIKYTRQMYMRMKKAGVLTPMIEQLAQDTSRVTKTGKQVLFARPAKDTTKNQLINDIRAYKKVITSKYFGIKGGKAFQEYWAANFGNGGQDDDDEEWMTGMENWAYNEAWRIFTRLKKEKQITDKSPDELIPEIYNMLMVGMSPEDVITKLNELYGPQAVEQEDSNEV